MVEGHGAMVATKTEKESDDELQQKIQDPYSFFVALIVSYCFEHYPFLEDYEAEIERLRSEVAP